MNDSNTIDSRLKKYMALACGLTAVAGSVNAQIIYTDVDPDILVEGDGNSFSVDFNGDMKTDISFIAGVVNGTFYSSSSSFSTFTTNKVEAILPEGTNAGWMGVDGNVRNNNAGDAIDARGAFATGIGSLANMRIYTSASGSGPFVAPNGAFIGLEGYVGVKFDIGGSVHYGWVRLAVSSDGTILTVKDFAYETISEASIEAGDNGFMSAPTINQTANILCGDDHTGEIVASGNGGVGPYTYSWTDADMNVVGTDATLSNVGAGTYEVTVTDAALNSVSSSFTITDPLNLGANTSSTEDTGSGDGTIDLSVVGGSAPYRFDWDNDGTGDFDDKEDLSELVAGVYTVMIKDNNDCTIKISETVESSVGVEESTSIISKVFPNPSTGVLTIQFGQINGEVEVSLVDATGRILLQDSKFNAKKIEMNISQFSTGIYSLIVKTGNNVSEVKIIKE